MTHAASSSKFSPGPLVLAALIVLATLSRLLPLPPNFSPVEAIALFGAAYYAGRHWALLVPLAAMLVSDAALALVHGGLYASYFGKGGFWLVYLCILAITLMGFGLRGKVSGGRVLGYSLLGSVVFFLVTNAGVWWGSRMYPQTFEGLLAAYAAGVPFFKWTVLSTLFYAGLLFGGFELLRRRIPALRASTV